MRRASRIDTNQPAIVRALRQVGASVQHLHQLGAGCPDILVGFRGQNHLIEIKDGSLPPSKRCLTPDEEVWHLTWGGSVSTVHDASEALAAIGARDTGGTASNTDPSRPWIGAPYIPGPDFGGEGP